MELQSFLLLSLTAETMNLLQIGERLLSCGLWVYKSLSYFTLWKVSLGVDIWIGPDLPGGDAVLLPVALTVGPGTYCCQSTDPDPCWLLHGEGRNPRGWFPGPPTVHILTQSKHQGQNRYPRAAEKPRKEDTAGCKLEGESASGEKWKAQCYRELFISSLVVFLELPPSVLLLGIYEPYNVCWAGIVIIKQFLGLQDKKELLWRAQPRLVSGLFCQKDCLSRLPGWIPLAFCCLT